MKTKILLALFLGVLLLPGGAMAIPFADLNPGTNITVFDGQGSGSGWYGTQEDQEVEPGCIGTQAWDLEAIFWNDTTSMLYIVGGFDFLNGETHSGYNYSIGDVFLFGSNDYALDLTRDNGNLLSVGSFTAYEDPFSTGPLPTDILESDPYLYESGGANVGSGGYQVYSGVTAAPFTGTERYALEINLTGNTMLIAAVNSGSLIHNTLECGNDEINGSVPEPGTILLLGTGLIGMAGICRRKFFIR